MKVRRGTPRKQGTASIKVACPAVSPGDCTGMLELRTADRVKLGGLNVAVHLGSARFNIDAGASKTVKVTLAKGSQRLADKHGHLKVLAVASTGPTGKIAKSSRHLTLTLGQASTRR